MGSVAIIPSSFLREIVVENGPLAFFEPRQTRRDATSKSDFASNVFDQSGGVKWGEKGRQPRPIELV